MTDSALAVLEPAAPHPFAPSLADLPTLPDVPIASASTAPIAQRPVIAFDRDTLYAEFQPLVRRLIRQYGEDAETRCDLQGEIYYRFCLLLDAYDPSRGVPLRPYLVRQLTTSIYTYARQGWRRQKREVTLESTLGQAEPTTGVDPSREWDEGMVTEQVLKMLPESIAKLPERQRNVIVWRYYDSMSFEEIAAILKIQVSTARSMLRHGINNLRKNIGCNRFAFD